MKMTGIVSEDLDRAVRETVSSLVRADLINGTYFINLPLLYPDGSFVTVRVDRVERGVRISDFAFAFRQADDLEAGKSFPRLAKRVAEEFDVSVAKNSIFTDVTPELLHRAIIDVGCASWKVADSIASSIQEDDNDLLDELKEKLRRVFGSDHVREEAKIVGVSTNAWDVSAVVTAAGRDTIFQAVSSHANSIYKASTAFRDIAGLDKPPNLVAVVRSRNVLGQRLALLAPARVIEESQSEDFFLRAAA